MLTGGKRARFIIVSVLLIAGSAPGVLSQTKPGPLVNPRGLNVSDISVPAEAGYVMEVHPSLSSANAPILIHIQEAHVNYEGQKHLAEILERLVKDYGLRLILVEGGEGDVSLTRLRRYGIESRRQAAEEYLRTGIISGEEYLDVTTDYPLILWGVEEEALYQQNVQAFLEAEALRGTLQPTLRPVRHAIEILTARLADPRSVELDRAKRGFEEGTTALADYAQTLARLADQAELDETRYPNLSGFLAVRELEQAIDGQQAQAEQEQLVEALRRNVNETELEALEAKIKGLKEGTVTHAAFYGRLKTLADAGGLSLASYPNLARYVRYIEEGASIKPAALSEELDGLAAALQSRLSATPARRQLQIVSEQFDLVEKLFDLRLSPQEYQRFQSFTLTGLASGWADVLSRLLAQEGLPAQSFDGLEHVEAALPKLKRFYEAAGQRDERIVEHTLAKLEETHEPLAVLITGGFHSPRVTQLLKDRGLGVVVVAPKVGGTANDEPLYRAVLKYKTGHGSFEEVQAAANVTSPTVTARR